MYHHASVNQMGWDTALSSELILDSPQLLLVYYATEGPSTVFPMTLSMLTGR